MIALDTNVLARFFVLDPEDAEALLQSHAATAAMNERAFVPITVLLEFEWVLRGFYGFSRTEIICVFTALFGFENISLEDRHLALEALDSYADGFDFADALHLAKSSRANSFVTFDRRLAKSAAQQGSKPEVILLRSATRPIPSGNKKRARRT